MVNRQPSSLKATKSADDRVWCVAARGACSASHVLQFAPASSVLTIRGNKSEEELQACINYVFNKHISLTACECETMAHLTMSRDMFFETIFQYLNDKCGRLQVR